MDSAAFAGCWERNFHEHVDACVAGVALAFSLVLIMISASIYFLPRPPGKGCGSLFGMILSIRTEKKGGGERSKKENQITVG